MIQDDELSAGLDVACVVFSQTLVEALVRLDQAQNLQVVLLLMGEKEYTVSKGFVVNSLTELHLHTF